MSDLASVQAPNAQDAAHHASEAILHLAGRGPSHTHDMRYSDVSRLTSGIHIRTVLVASLLYTAVHVASGVPVPVRRSCV